MPRGWDKHDPFTRASLHMNLRDRDGTQIASADRVELVDPDTGQTIARGIVTVIEGPRKCKVRWDGAPKDSRELGDEIVVVPHE